MSTPRTDAFMDVTRIFGVTTEEVADYARQLESELNSAMKIDGTRAAELMSKYEHGDPLKDDELSELKEALQFLTDFHLNYRINISGNFAQDRNTIAGYQEARKSK